MSTENLPELPSAGEALSRWLGFKLPAVPLPQTFKNVDKAISRVVGLIEPASDLLTAYIERKSLQIKAKSQAEVDLIRAASALRCDNLDHDQLADRAIEYAVRDSILKQENKEKITRLAMEHVTQRVENNSTMDADREIDDDWLSSFEEIASNKSNKDIQTLWAKILSGEIRQPGSFRLRSLSMLAMIDHSEAEKIHNILSKVISYEFIFNDSQDDVREALEGEYLGIIKGGEGLLSKTINVDRVTDFSVGGEIIRIEFDAPKSISMPAFPLTRFGRELLSLSDTYEAPEIYVAAVLKCLAQNGAKKISRAQIMKRLGNKTLTHGPFVESSPQA